MVLTDASNAGTRQRVYIDPHFLDAPGCQRVRRAMDAGERESADILHDAVEHHEHVRRATYVDVPEDVLLEMESKLDAARDAVATFFGLALTSREGAGFVRYMDGGFYLPHRDRATVPSFPDAARRAIAAVVFLSSSRDAGAEGDFNGGILRLLEGHAQDLVPRQGTLVAFRADVLHEVTVVRDGIRDAIVDWFY